MGECSFKRIGGVRHAEMWVMFTGEKPGKIRLQTPIGTAQSPVCEVPSLCEWVDSFLSKKLLPLRVPKLEPVTKARLVRLREKQHEFFQFLPSDELRFPRDVPQDDLHLMKLAHLDGNPRKGMHKPSSGIADDPKDVPFLFLQPLHSCDILRDGFIRQKLPGEIFVTVRATEDRHAEHFPEVRCIHHHYDITCLDQRWLYTGEIYLPLHPLLSSSEPLPYLGICLFSMCVRLQNSLYI